MSESPIAATVTFCFLVGLAGGSAGAAVVLGRAVVLGATVGVGAGAEGASARETPATARAAIEAIETETKSDLTSSRVPSAPAFVERRAVLWPHPAPVWNAHQIATTIAAVIATA